MQNARFCQRFQGRRYEGHTGSLLYSGKICCGYLLELPQQGVSYENHNIHFCHNKKTIDRLQSKIKCFR